MNILIVGLGSMGKRRARLIYGLKAGHTIAGVDSREERREEAEKLGIHAYATLPEALEAEQFDATFVCTAPLTHAIIIDELLNEELPVFSELNLVDTGYQALIQKAEEKNLTLFLSSTMLYRAETQYIQEQVHQFEKPVSYIYHIGQYLPDWHPWESYKNFFVGDARTSGVREILGIDLPWIVSAFGSVQSAHVEKAKISDLEIGYSDSYFIILRHENGNRGFLAVDVVSPKAMRQFEVYGEGLHIFWEGNPRTLAYYDTQTKQKTPVNTYEEYEHDPRYSDNIVENAYVDEILNFFAVVQGIENPRWGFKQDLEVIQLLDQIDGTGQVEE